MNRQRRAGIQAANSAAAVRLFSVSSGESRRVAVGANGPVSGLASTGLQIEAMMRGE